jgi:hypothetical protein
MKFDSHFGTFAYYLFFPLMTIFLLYVGTGYYIMISSQFPQWPVAALAAALFIVIGPIYFCVRHTGFSLYKVETGAKHPLAWLPWFLGLFLISGYGFLTSSMLLFVGPQIAVSEVQKLTEHLSKLEKEANAEWRDDDFDKFTSIVEGNRRTLIGEVQAHGNCGMGQMSNIAVKAIADLASKDGILFQLRSDLKPGPIKCSDSATINRYVDGITSATDTLIATKKKNVGRDEREARMKQIIDSVRSDEKQLDDVTTQLVGVNYFFDVGFYHSVLAVVGHVSEDYQRVAPKLKSGSLDVISDERELERLGQALELPGILVTRISHWDTAFKTLMLCFLALGCDFLVAYLVYTVLRHQYQVQKERKAVEDAAQVGGKDVTYLWKPMSSPKASVEGIAS